MTKCYINLTNEQNKFVISEAIFEKISCNILKAIINKVNIVNSSKLNSYDLNKYSLCIDILLCDDHMIKELNRAYRGKDKPTDVLSFALFADSPESRIIIDDEISLGEIIISVETAKNQADENGKSLEQELYFLLSHGVLHLFGFDHKDEESYNFMMQVQNEVREVYR